MNELEETRGYEIENKFDIKNKFDRAADGPFFNFSKPYLDFIGKEKIFSIVYLVMAGLNLLLPIGIIFKVVNSGAFRFMPAKFTVAFVFSWLVVAFACWVGFQLWWDRRKRVAAIAASGFIATQVFSEILQTFGEWLGTFVGIIGAGVGLIAAVILGKDGAGLFEVIGMEFLGIGALVIVAGPVIGFFIIVIFRFLAEQLRIFAALANNTNEIAVNIKERGRSGGVV